MKENAPLFSTSSNVGLPRARARFLAQAIQLEEDSQSEVISTAAYFSGFLLIAAIAWAMITEVNEVAVTQGKVIPAGLINDIQHLEGGIVSEIFVRNGDLVQEGDPLLSFAPPASKSEFDQVQIRRATLLLVLERLQAIVEDREPDFSEFSSQYPSLTKKQIMIYKAQLSSQSSELHVIDAQIRQRQSELARQKNLRKSIRQEVTLLKEQVDIRRKLAEKQLLARTDLLETQSKLAGLKSEERKVSDGIAVASMALNEARERRTELIAHSKKDLELEIGERANELAEVDQSLIRLQDKVNRLNIFAPLTGIVQGLAITRIHAVVEPGQVILQIVPTNDELIVESRVSPEDIGYVHKGQPADVKIDSYDSSRFGVVKGSVRQISATTYFDEKRNPYYRAEISLEKDYVGNQPENLRIIPGMTVQADIRTGSKSILDYLMKPVSRGFDHPFKER